MAQERERKNQSRMVWVGMRHRKTIMATAGWKLGPSIMVYGAQMYM